MNDEFLQQNQHIVEKNSECISNSVWKSTFLKVHCGIQDSTLYDNLAPVDFVLRAIKNSTTTWTTERFEKIIDAIVLMEENRLTPTDQDHPPCCNP